ncbi:MAG: hypothetical protein N2444_02990 [Methylocystis sp.]|nr:hypothetical protein [Methylocystis sp.]
MKKLTLGLFALAGLALTAPASAQSGNPLDAVTNMFDPGSEAQPPVAPAANSQTAEKKSYSRWWRNRQIERGPGSLRPGHHRRLFRRTVPKQ